jgi:hypothetical protein
MAHHVPPPETGCRTSQLHGSGQRLTVLLIADNVEPAVIYGKGHAARVLKSIGRKTPHDQNMFFGNRIASLLERLSFLEGCHKPNSSH